MTARATARASASSTAPVTEAVMIGGALAVGRLLAGQVARDRLDADWNATAP